jgi:tRNA A37 threonylcarbamoyladenosine dehydratase
MVQVILTARPRYNAFLVLCKTKKEVMETISSGAGKYLNPNLIIIQDIKLRKKNPLTNNLKMLEKTN